MKVAIDTFGCDNGKSGPGSYITNFISNLPEELVPKKHGTTINADTNKENLEGTREKKSTPEITFELFGIEEDRYTYTSGKDIPYSSAPMLNSPKAERIWHKTNIHKFIKKNGYDVVLYPAAARVLPSKFKNHLGIAIVNSILSNDIPEMGLAHKKQLLKGLKNIQKIIAATQFIKQDLINLGIDENKIDVIHNGIDHKLFFPMVDLNDDVVDVKPFAIKRPYFVYGSSLSSPDKKHIELIHAFERFKKNTGLPHRLVISGNDGAYAEEIHKAAFDSEYASDIFLIGFFPHESFARLYAGAEACLFPSVNEGVGLPILEAMACGIPVLCSDKGALKEVGGASAIYFDSDNIDNISSEMEQIVENKELKEKVIFDSILWANEFNWEKTVKETLKLLKN